MKILLPLVLCCLFLFAIGTSTQAQNKIGYISLQELIPAMPEYKKAEKDLGDYQKALTDQISEYRRQFEAKDSVFKKDSITWTPAVREVKRKELNELALKAYNYQQEAQQLYQQREQDLLAPIQKKAVETTQAVAKENGYAYILSKEQLIAFPSGEDVLPLVAKKMGIKIEPSTAAAGK